MFGDRSLFAFRRVSVFDAQSTLRFGALVLGISITTLYLLGPAWGWFVVCLVVGGSFLLARLDRRRPSCISLRLDDVVVDAFQPRGGFLMADVYSDRSSVAKLRRRMHRFDHIYLPPTRRRIPLASLSTGWRAHWRSGDALLDLDAGEIPGALTVVLKGSDLSIELLVGALPDRPSAPLAVRVESSEGAVESWDPLLRPSEHGVFRRSSTKDLSASFA